MHSIRFISITTLLLLLAWAQVPAQSRFGKIVEVRFGLAGGANWSALTTLRSAVSGSSADYTQGWHAGAFAEIGFLFVGVRPGAYYTNAGKLFANGSQVIDPSLTDFDVTYVSVPIDVKLGIPLPVIMPYIFVGPEFKFNTVSDSEGELAQQLESTVIAANAGIGGRLTFGRLNLYPEFRVVFSQSGFLIDSAKIGSEQIQSEPETGYVLRLGLGI